MSEPSRKRGRPPKVTRGRGRPPAAVSRPPVLSISTPSIGVCEEELDGDGGSEEVEVLMLPRKRGRPPLNPKPSSSKPANNGGGGGAGEGRDYDFIGGGGGGNSGVPTHVLRRLAKCLPAMVEDGEDVECGDCGRKMNFFQFRIHNIQCHINTAPTKEEKVGLVMDHKYFARKLNEFKRLTKMTIFSCPRKGCTSSFKSTLGLAYHMNTCGRTQEELDAVLIECEICHMKLSLPNMAWHRKSHEEKTQPLLEEEDDESRSSFKRNSAIAARKTFKRMSGKDDNKGRSGEDDDDEWNSEDDDEGPEVEEVSSSPSSSKRANRQFRKRADKEKPIMDLDSNDYNVLALEFLEHLDQRGHKAWDDPPRIVEDPFLALNISDNCLQAPEQGPEIEAYLPSHKTSVEFKCTTSSEETEEGGGGVASTSSSSSGYHSLNWFEGETVEVASSTISVNKRQVTHSASVHHTGGPVLSMAWHPSGKFLAVSVGNSIHEELDSLISQERKSCLQIYRRSGSVLSLQLVLGVQWGYATHIQWSSFCPDIMDSYNPQVESCFDDIEIYARLGYLAMCCEDAIVRIMSLGIQDLKVAPNFEYKPPYKIKVYTKTPEIELKVDESVIEDSLGNAVRFDWHEENRYFAVGYANGFVGVYDLQTVSPLLVQRSMSMSDEGVGGVTVINPFWTFQGHRLGVRGVIFDPVDPRYLLTCGQDRQMRVWDLNTRTERENKRTGICLDMCWVRGWIHQMASFENVVAYQSSMHNYVRIFQTGSAVGKPSSAEIFNVTSLDFYHGLTAQGTEDGKVNATYYDWFWRDCDYERNRKKKNLAVISSVEVDKGSYRSFSAEDFSVEVKKLKKSVLNSKLYQRLAVNEDEGVYSISLEAKFGDLNIFEELPEIEDDEEEDGGDFEGEDGSGSGSSSSSSSSGGEDEEEDKENGGGLEGMDGDQKLFSEEDDDKDNCSELVVSDAINSAVTKAKDGLIPIYDVKNPEGAPRLNISLSRKRPTSAVPVEGLEPRQIEEYIRFHSYIRINKVVWSPNGDVLAVGYRNGLITLLPGSFDSIFQT